MNANKLKGLCKKISLEKNVSFNIVLKYFFFEKFLQRLSVSRYKDNFILKGGFLLSLILGLQNRHTQDLDISVDKFKLEEDNLIRAIKEIIDIDLNDNTVIKFKRYEKIKESAIYTGVSLFFECRFDNIIEVFSIDCATGDVITPHPEPFTVNSLFFKDTKFDLMSYNYETMIAEKIETISSQILYSSRMKDFYDLYITYELNRDAIDLELLRIACENTFKNRNHLFDLNKLIVGLKYIKNEAERVKQWERYTQKKQISLDINDVINTIEQFLLLIFTDKK